MKKLTQEEFDKIWGKRPLIIIDTNSILDLYRHATSKAEGALRLLQEVPKEQIFIPSQVYQEYNRNKQSVINMEYKKITNVNQDIERSITKATNSIEKRLYEYKLRHYPAITELETDINELVSKIKQKAHEYEDSNQNEIKQNRLMLQNDKVEPFINELKEAGCIGEGFSMLCLLKIYEEGERRFKYQIPPGYKDLKKDEKDPTKREKFGDLIVWKELLNKARNVDRDIIYLTSDKKEWKTDKNGNKFPDQLLFDEFQEYSSRDLYFWELNDLVVMLSDYDQEDHLVRNVELNDYEILEAIFYTKDLISIIESDELKLTNYLIHSGELQDYLNNVLEDVEITEYGTPEINEFSIEIIDRQAVIVGDFYVLLSLTITEYFTKEFSSNIDARVEVSGNFSITVDINPDEILEEETFKSCWINFDTVKTKFGGFEILSYEENIAEDDPYFQERCINCGKRNTSYFTKAGDPVCQNCSIYYTSCPSCGRLFKEPLLDPVCEGCGGSNYDLI